MSGAKIWVTPEPLTAEVGSICTEETNTIGDIGFSQHVAVRLLFVRLIMVSIVSHTNCSLSMMLMGSNSNRMLPIISGQLKLLPCLLKHTHIVLYINCLDKKVLLFM